MSGKKTAAAHVSFCFCLCSDTLMPLQRTCRPPTMFVSYAVRKWSLEPRNCLATTFSTPGRSPSSVWVSQNSKQETLSNRNSVFWVHIFSLILCLNKYYQQQDSFLVVKLNAPFIPQRKHICRNKISFLFQLFFLDNSQEQIHKYLPEPASSRACFLLNV